MATRLDVARFASPAPDPESSTYDESRDVEVNIVTLRTLVRIADNPDVQDLMSTMSDMEILNEEYEEEEHE